MRHIVCFVSACAVVLASPLLAERPAVPEADLRSRPAFSLDGPALLSLRGAPEPGHDVTILLDESSYTFDAEGRCTTRSRVVFTAATQAEAERWGIIEQTWSPWYQAAPQIRARVVTPDGAVHELDPKTVADAPADEEDTSLLGNRRRARAPLPAMTAGVVVEQEVTIREERPLMPEGVVRRTSAAWSSPVRHSRVVLEAPESLPLEVKVRGEGLSGERSASGGRVRFTYTGGPFAAFESFERNVPSDVAQLPGLEFATGASWQRVAAAYAQIVSTRIGDAGLEPLVRSLVARSDRPRAAAAKLLARLQRDVRYTGVEFDEATIVPSRPGETLKRRFGDCKDKSTLLVAMLETAGIPANVALLSTGPGADVDEALPGLGRFDHAIVYVPGPDPFWIDPTSEFSRVGELPPADRGRRALVVAATTTGLTRTPEAAAADNRSVEEREFFLAESGPARIVETTLAWGDLEEEYRRSQAGQSAKALGEGFEKYAKEEYLARPGVPKWEASTPTDLSKPFRLRIEVPAAGRGATDEKEAAMAILPSAFASALPSELQGGGDEEEGDAEGSKAEKPRRHDYVFFVPFTKELRYRVTPPPGFTPLPLPENATEPLGTGTLTREFAAEKDGVVTAVLRLQTGKTRITAAEVAKWRTDLAALRKAEPIYVRFQQTGMAHLRAGRVREALEEFRRLAALHPREARHRCQRASALLAGGLGEAARTEARAAIGVEPGSAEAHRTLAWILQHDLVGRRFKKGWDRAGAIAGYRKAKELDPKDVVARADLAIVLEHDGDGERWAKGADLAGAVEEYRALRKDLKENRFNTNLLLCLVALGDPAAVAEEAKGMDPSMDRNDALVLAAALKGGTAAAVREADRLVAERDKRRESLQRVGFTLLRWRHYERAAEVLGETIAGAPNEAQLRATVEQVKKARRHEDMKLLEDDPATPVRRFFIGFLSPEGTADEALKGLFVARVRATWESQQKGIRSVKRMAQQQGVPPEVALDLALAVFDFHVEGRAATGWRVRVRGAASGGREVNETLFVTKEEGALRIAALGREIASAGWEIRRRLDAGDAEGARQWLDWAREEVWAGRGDDPYSGEPLARFWAQGAEADPARMAVAADALLAEIADEAPDVAARLEAARAAAAGGEERDRLDLALAAAYRARKSWKELEPVAARLMAAHPESISAFTFRFGALMSLKRTAEARSVAEERLRRIPGDAAATRNLSRAAIEAGRLDEAIRLREGLVSAGKAESIDYNELAWLALFTDGVSDTALERARRGAELSQQSSWGILHTLAALDAEAGRASEAFEVILKAIALKPEDEPESNDWYVFGRIAELYGESRAAVSAYGRVVRPGPDESDAVSTWRLAQRRLDAMKGGAPPVAAKRPPRAG